MKKDAYYFPHFCNARHDRKLKRVQKELGVEGYGIYFMLLEVLRDQQDFKYPLDDIDLLADEFGTSEQKVNTVICNYKLFDMDEEKNFTSHKMQLYLQPYLERSKKAQTAARARWDSVKNNAQALPEHTPSNADAMQGKESKVKEYSAEIKNFTAQFQNYVLEKNPIKGLKVTDKLLDSCNETVDKLIRIDGFKLDYIIPCLKWGINNDFWKGQLFSLAPLRGKSKNGVKKFINLSEAYDKDLNDPANQPEKEKIYVA